jgi:hypothetical protein
MTAIPTEPEARRAYFAALGRAGGTATYRVHGVAHMAALGRAGFATTLGRYGGDFVWRLLHDSYLHKFPDRTGPRRRTTDEAREKDRLRAEARRLHPDPQPCADCGESGTERDHIHGVLAGNAPDNLAWRCDGCHDEKTRCERHARWGAKGTPQPRSSRDGAREEVMAM